jgi:hypothetical protein
VAAEVKLASGGVWPFGQLTLFQVPSASRARVLLSATSLVLRFGTPMMLVKPSPAAIISGLEFQISALMITSRRSTR